jgi:ABC-type multidrug transport system fused ATPase/permease subunit
MKILNWSILQETLSLLPRNTSRKIVLLVFIQISLSALDILAILLLGITSQIGLGYVQNKSAEFPKILTQLLGIENLEFEVQGVVVSILIVGLFAIRTVVSIYLNNRILLYLANNAGYASKQIIEKVFRSKPQSIISRNSQEFLYGITAGVDNLTLTFLAGFTTMVTEMFFLSAIVFVVILVQPITGLIAFFVFAFAALGINKITANRARSLSSENAKASISVNQKLLETLFVYRELFLRDREISVPKEVQIARLKSLVIRAQIMMLPTLSKHLFELTLVLGGALVALVQLIVSDSMTAISSVAIFLAAASRILPSLIRVQGALTSIRGSEGSSEVTIKQLREIEMEEIHVQKSLEIASENPSFVPKLKVSNLNFNYHDKHPFVLEDINFEVSAGQFVAIVGESGAGKTTLIDLILGMLTPTSGRIEISNHPPLESIHRWPGRIAYVPQDIVVIDGDIKKNVVLRESNDNLDDKVLIALEKSHLKEDVLNMKDGLNELVGERGMRLSGGQRQRLGIARALFSNPEMIFFDEATSSLDPITEKTVTEAIYEKKGNVTLIVVAHRLSTVKSADLVILLDKGRIVAQGTFEDVRRASPKFDQQAKLVNL